MKLILITFTFCLIIIYKGLSQGVDTVPEKIYGRLNSPPLEAGSGLSDTGYVIPLKFFPNPGKQGKDKSCVGWAAGYTYLSYLQNTKKATSFDKSKVKIFSPWYLYKQVKTCSDCKCGIRTDLALDYLKLKGNVPIQFCPYSVDDCNVPAGLDSIALEYRITDWAKTEDLLNFKEIKGYLTNDIPVLAIIKADNTFKEFRDTNENHPLDENLRYDYEYHAIVIIGYSDNKDAFKIINSYGTNWGSKGYAWIKYSTFRKILKEAYIIKIEGDNQFLASLKLNHAISIEAGASKAKIDSSDFIVLGSKEAIYNGNSIRTDRFHYTFKINAKPEILNQVSKVTYYYNHPTFIHKYSISNQPPNFPNSYDGWGCLTKMSAKIILINDSIVNINFNGCAVIANPTNEKVNFKNVDLFPYVTAKFLSKNNFKFNIDIRGIEKVEPYIDSVRYNWNHQTFKNPISFANELYHYSNGYTGWGCLTGVEIVIFFTDGYQRKINVDMCDLLGWTDGNLEEKKAQRNLKSRVQN